MEDITGKRFGLLVAKRFIRRGRHGEIHWECVCDCGKTTDTVITRLRHGHTKSCGCLKHSPSSSRANLIGHVFGRLRVVSFSHLFEGAMLWKCECSCNRQAVRIYSSHRLLGGRIRSCGCLRREFITKMKTKHGFSTDGDRAPEYGIWRAMKTRCYNQNSNAYENYGGRGIAICERWLESFLNFYKDMGARPSSNHSIDRIDVNGNYEPGNCRWATDEEQCNNRRDTVRVTYHGETLSIAQWGRRIGRNPHALKCRLKKMSVEEAMRPKKEKQSIFPFARTG